MIIKKYAKVLATVLSISLCSGQGVWATELGDTVGTENSTTEGVDNVDSLDESRGAANTETGQEDTSSSAEASEKNNSEDSSAKSVDSDTVDSKKADDESAEEKTEAAAGQDSKTDSQESELATAGTSLASSYKLQCRVHRQTYGWSDWIDSDSIAGTVGEGKRLEAIQIRIVDKNGNATSQYHVSYKVHRQTYGWTDWVSDGGEAGTTGEGKRLEAICIKVTDNSGNTYQVSYRVHAQTYGWMDTVSGSAEAGTTGQGKRLEAIVLSLNGTIPTPSSNSTASDAQTTKATITYSGHVQTFGDVAAVENGAQLGTTGLGKRIEGMTINLIQPSSGGISGNIVYQAHVQTYGWLDSVTNGNYCGTIGQAKRMEAIKISLTGELANQYDVYYRVHSQTYGWLGWAMNGDAAGTEGYAKRLEAIEIRLVKKGESAPTIAGDAFLKKVSESSTDTSKVAAIKQYLGTKYVWGGNTPSTGWDCSGCAIWLLKNLFGISLSGRATYQIVYEGSAVSLTDRNQWQVGDLIFFGDTVATNSHVGMYIGNGEIFHAADENTGTIVTKLANWIWGNSHIVAVRRYK